MVVESYGLSALRQTFITREIQPDNMRDGPASEPSRMLTGGQLTITPESENFLPVENRRSFVERHDTWHQTRSTALSWEGVCDFNEVVDFLLMGMVGFNHVVGHGMSLSPESGSTGAYLWAFRPFVRWPQLSTDAGRKGNLQDTYTFWHTDRVIREFDGAGPYLQYVKIPYVLVTELSFAGGISEAVTLSASMMGAPIELIDDSVLPDGSWENWDAWSSSIGSSSAKLMLMSRSRVYTVTSSNSDSPFKVSLGDTNSDRTGIDVLDGVVRGWEFTINTGLTPFYAPRSQCRTKVGADTGGLMLFQSANLVIGDKPGREAGLSYTSHYQRMHVLRH